MSDIVETLIHISDVCSLPIVKSTDICGKHLAKIVGVASGELDVIILLPDGPAITNVKTQSKKNIESECTINRYKIVYLNIHNGVCDIYPVCLGDTPITDGYKNVKKSSLVFRSKTPIS